LKPENILLK
jgi:dual specificity tyrosine-phosphorylation-regulated kinase 2/3/4